MEAMEAEMDAMLASSSSSLDIDDEGPTVTSGEAPAIEQTTVVRETTVTKTTTTTSTGADGETTETAVEVEQEHNVVETSKNDSLDDDEVRSVSAS